MSKIPFVLQETGDRRQETGKSPVLMGHLTWESLL